jgi:hypothetical protein
MSITKEQYQGAWADQDAELAQHYNGKIDDAYNDGVINATIVEELKGICALGNFQSVEHRLDMAYDQADIGEEF